MAGVDLSRLYEVEARHPHSHLLHRDFGNTRSASCPASAHLRAWLRDSAVADNRLQPRAASIGAPPWLGWSLAALLPLGPGAKFMSPVYHLPARRNRTRPHSQTLPHSAEMQLLSRLGSQLKPLHAATHTSHGLQLHPAACLAAPEPGPPAHTESSLLQTWASCKQLQPPWVGPSLRCRPRSARLPTPAPAPARGAAGMCRRCRSWPVSSA